MKETGEFLRTERLRNGLTPAFISMRTRISVEILRALEEGDWHRIGPPVSIRNFLKSYCEVVGIDPAPLLDKHAREIAGFDRQAEGFRRYAGWARTLKNKKRPGFFAVLVPCFALVGVLYGAVWVSERKTPPVPVQCARDSAQEEIPADLSRMMAGRSAREGEPQVAGKERVDIVRRASDADSMIPLAEAGRVALPPASAAVVPAPRSHKLAVVAEKYVWLRVTPDGGKPVEARLKPGEKREWEIPSGVQIILGKNSRARLTWDDQDVALPAAKGKSATLRLPAS